MITRLLQTSLLTALLFAGFNPANAAGYRYGGCGGLLKYGAGGFKETDAEKAERKAREKKRAEEREKIRQSTIGMLLPYVSKRTAANDEAMDEVEFQKLRDALTGTGSPWSATFAIGNPTQKLNEDLIDRAIEITTFLKELGYFVLFDADATIAPEVAKVLGDRGLGISAGRKKIKDVPNYVVIKNDYLRLEAFKIGEKIITNDDSILGMALSTNGSLDFFIGLEQPKSHKLDLDKWEPGYMVNLGLKYKKIDWLTLGEVERIAPNFLSTEDLLQSLDLADLVTIYERQENMDKARAILKDEATKSKSGFGAVVFGSGQYPGAYTQSLYSAIRALAEKGIPITTGGAGGVMEIGNQAAYDAGAVSIGIGLGGKLDSEKDSNTSIQTTSMDVAGYEERIPLLLSNKKIIVIAPGGMGTMKELATTLMQESAATADRAVIFYGGEYYARMYKDVIKALPKSVAKNYFLANTPEEVIKIVDNYVANVWTKDVLAQVGSFQKPKARNNKTDFSRKPTPKKKKKSKKDDEWGGSW